MTQHNANSAPVEIKFRGESIFLHEPGCQCGYEHDGRFTDPNNTKVAVLTLVDERANLRYFQIWFRSAKWTLHEAMEQLLERVRNGRGGKAA
jgi:hypothetical protein